MEGGSALSPASVGGRRRSHKLRLVKKKTVRRMLAKKGLKMRGGGTEGMAPPSGAASAAAPVGGRRHRRSHKRTHRRGMFHF
jgi:hypothetical protein